MSTSTSTLREFRVPTTYIIALIPAAVALNVVGSFINDVLRLPFFLDMIGTAVVAITIGPWWGALAGALTNTVLGFISSPISLPFAVVNVVGALVWGYGVRLGMGKTLVRFFILSLIVAVASSTTATPIYIFVFGGATGHFSDMMTAAFVGMGRELITAVFSSNIIVSLGDKIISSFLALAIIEALPPALTSHLDIAKAPRMTLVAWIVGAVVVTAVVIQFVVIPLLGN
jgi:energy-coupling factor transport system substrate-specific component